VCHGGGVVLFCNLFCCCEVKRGKERRKVCVVFKLSVNQSIVK
jgi:hypothetical protein